MNEEINENMKEVQGKLKEYNKETIDQLLDLTKKEKHISQISEVLQLSDFEVLGLVHDLIDSGINIIVKQYDDGFHLLNQGDTIDKDVSTYSFETDDSNEFSFIAISDTRLGSKSQQLAILNDIYRKAQEMGIKNVILCGNISAGLKPMTDTESNFVYDTQTQINYIIDNYPKYEGIKTYFITGKLDDKHIANNNINIGKRIADAREDMIYLGYMAGRYGVNLNGSPYISYPPKGCANGAIFNINACTADTFEKNLSTMGMNFNRIG